MKFYDTNLPNNYSKGLFEEKGANLAPEHTDKIADVAFTATAMVLNGSKSKEQPVALKFVREDGSMVAAGIAQYFENNDDPDQPGNWNLVFTFDENDIPDNCNIMLMTNPQLHPFFRSVSGDRYHFTFKTPATVIDLPTYFFEQLRKWLDENTKEGEEISIECDGVFQARGAVEGGEKVFSIEPAGEIKMLIKDDAAIEK